MPSMIPQLAQQIVIDPSPERRWIDIPVFALGPPKPGQDHFLTLAGSLVKRCLSLDMGRAPFEFGGVDPAADLVGKSDMASQFTLFVHETMNNWGPGPLYQYWFVQTFIGKWRERFLMTLAIILELGPEWIVGTAMRCGHPGPELVVSKLLPILSDATGWDYEELKSLQWSKTETGREAVNAILSFANWAVTWGNDRVYGMSSGCLPVLHDHGPGGHGKAMVYMRPDALVQVVIPNMLLEEHYSRLYRVWLLEAKDDPFYEKMQRGLGAEWFLRAKAILLTNVEDADTCSSNGSARDGQPGWRFRPKVRVHGPPQDVGDAIKDHLKLFESNEGNPVLPGTQLMDRMLQKASEKKLNTNFGNMAIR